MYHRMSPADKIGENDEARPMSDVLASGKYAYTRSGYSVS
jgi:hypothetical protein